MTAVSIITGFLGSGKTTLLRALLQRGLAGQRLALVVNEIGAVPFDGRLLESRHLAGMVELTGGCICCALGSDFLLAIEELVEMAAPDLILIETTGLAEPLSMARQVRAADLPLDSIIAVADAANLHQALELATVAEWQLRAADFVLLSKRDLVTPAEFEAAQATVRRYNTRAALFDASQGELNWEAIFGITHTTASSLLNDTPPDDHLAHDGFVALTWHGDLPLERERLEATVRALQPEVYRLKGHVHTAEAPWPTLLNVVCGRADYTTTRFRNPPAHLNELALIGPLAGREEELFAALAACVADSERVARWLAAQGE